MPDVQEPEKHWRQLDPATRKSLRNGVSATDPGIDLIARAYAESALRMYRTRWTVGGTLGAAVLAVLLVLLSESMGPTVVGMVFVAAWLGFSYFAGRQRLMLVRVLNASRSGREPIAAGTAAPLEIRVSGVGIVKALVGPLVIGAIFIFFGVLLAMPVLLGFGIGLAIVVLAYIGYSLVVWALPGRLAYVLDFDGIHTPKRGARVGWEHVREIRVVPLRPTTRDRRKVIAFVLHDDDLYLRQLPRWAAFLSTRNKKTYLSPMFFIDGLADKSIDEIATVAAALSSVPTSVSTFAPAG